MCGMKENSTSPPCGNLVDSLPHDCHNTQTIAWLARLGPAKNGTTLTKNGRVDKVLLDHIDKSAQDWLCDVC